MAEKEFQAGNESDTEAKPVQGWADGIHIKELCNRCGNEQKQTPKRQATKTRTKTKAKKRPQEQIAEK